jgi:nucleoside-diphosphate-sugar epimerase
MDKISVFGSTGFIGSNFCNMYPDEVDTVDVIDGIFPNNKNILYLISTTDNYNVMSDPHIDINTNLNVLVDILWRNKDRKDLVFNFVSSWFVYGDVELPAKEDACCKPKGFYSITKKCAEDLLISFCQTYDLKYKIFRLANVIGVGDRGVSPKKNALQYLIEKLAYHEPIQLYYGGSFRRDYLHVDDVCKAIHFCIQNAPTNEIINISANWENYYFIDLIYYAKRKLNSESYIEEVEPSDFHKIVQVKDMVMSCTKLYQLGWKPEKTAYDAIDEVIDEIQRKKQEE